MGGTSILGGLDGGGGLDLTSRLEAKFGARSGQVQSWRKIPILGSNLKLRG